MIKKKNIPEFFHLFVGRLDIFHSLLKDPIKAKFCKIQIVMLCL